MIGSLGGVVFEVSENHVRTFDNLSFSQSNNYAEHKILNRNTLLEYTGKNARTCSLKIELNAISGLDVKEELNNLHDMLKNHEANIFLLGDEVIGSFVIDSMSENYNIISRDGIIESASVNLSMKEDEE